MTDKNTTEKHGLWNNKNNDEHKEFLFSQVLNFFPQRTAILLKQLEEYSLYNPTGIHEVQDLDNQDMTSKYDDSVARNLQGIPVDNTYHGIVIVNGRKIMR